jgi:hypothetical protein
MDMKDPYEYFYTTEGHESHKIQCAHIDNTRIDFKYISIWRSFLIKSKLEHEQAREVLPDISIVKSKSTLGSTQDKKIYEVAEESEDSLWKYFMNFSSSIILACSALEAYANEKLYTYKPLAEDLKKSSKVFDNSEGSLEYDGHIERTLKLNEKVFIHIPKHLAFSDLQISAINKHRILIDMLIKIRNELIHYKFGKNRTVVDSQTGEMRSAWLAKQIFPRNLRKGDKRTPFAAFELVNNLINEFNIQIKK